MEELDAGVVALVHLGTNIDRFTPVEVLGLC